jgi:hypothetical protein
MSNASDFIIKKGILEKYTGSGGIVLIPESVTVICKDAFFQCSNITEVTFPESLTAIHDNSFSGCTNLQKLSIPDNVTSIGDYAFQGCSGMKEISLPEGLKTIGRQLFYGCSSLQTVFLPNSVRQIGNYAFANCSSLTEIRFSPILETIGVGAFKGCGSVEHIELPWGIDTVTDDVFCDCVNLSGIKIPRRLKYLSGKAFRGCTKLADTDGFVVIQQTVCGYAGSSKDLRVPQGVTQIGHKCFTDCEELTSVRIPQSLRIFSTYKSKDAFLEAIGIRTDTNKDVKVILPYSADSFSSMDLWMKDIAAMNWLQDETDYSQELIEEIKKYIGRTRDRMFVSIGDDNGGAVARLLTCGKIKPETLLEYIHKCNDGKHPGMVTVLMDYQQKHIPKEKQAELADKELGFVEKSTKDWAKIYRWTEEEGGITIVKYKGIDTRVEIPWNIEGIPVTKIGKNAFKGNINLEEIVLSPNVTVIMDSAFEGCEKLAHITWNENLVTIGKRAFYGCYQLTVIKLPASVTELGVNSFSAKFNFGDAPLMHLSEVYLPENIKVYKQFLGEFMDYSVAVHFLGKKTKITAKDFYGAEVRIHVLAGSKTEEYAKKAGIRYLTE